MATGSNPAVWGALALAGLGGCVANLGIVGDARITCESTADCPDSWQCNVTEHKCFDPEANRPPTVILGTIARGVNEVTVPFVLEDTNAPPFGDDVLSVRFEFTTGDPNDPITVWSDATAAPASPPLTGIEEVGADVGYTFIWSALTDAMPAAGRLRVEDVDTDGDPDGVADAPVVVYTENIFIRAIATDASGAESEPALSSPFTVGNEPPDVTLLTFEPPLAGDIPIGFTLADSASDVADVEVEFMTVGGMWLPAHISLGTTMNLFTLRHIR